MGNRLAGLLGFLTVLAAPAAAQQLRPLPTRWVAAGFAVAQPRPAQNSGSPSLTPAERVLIGGALGAVAGLVTCQIISNAINSLDGGSQTGCTPRGNVQFAIGGAIVGGIIGWATYHKPHD